MNLMYISLLCIFKQNYRSHQVYGSHGIPAELFQILKDDAVKGLHSTFQQVWKAQEWQQDWKRSVFIPTPKKGNPKKMSKLLYNCTHLPCQQSNAQNSSSQASTVHEQRTSRCSSQIQKRQRNQRSNYQHLFDHRKSKRTPEKHLLLLH